jgi:hypothetical protein
VLHTGASVHALWSARMLLVRKYVWPSWSQNTDKGGRELKTGKQVEEVMKLMLREVYYYEKWLEQVAKQKLQDELTTSRSAAAEDDVLLDISQAADEIRRRCFRLGLRLAFASLNLFFFFIYKREHIFKCHVDFGLAPFRFGHLTASA